MNSQLSTLDSQPAKASAAAGQLPPEPGAPPAPAIPAPISPVADPLEPQKRRPRGKIHRLAPAVRHRLNELIQDGLTYAEVLTTLGSDVSHITELDMCRWYSSGYQDWAKNQLWLEECRSRLDFSLQLVAESGASNIHHANLHIAATQLIDHLVKCGDSLLATDTETYILLLNGLSRLSHEALNHQRYSEACAAARAQVAILKDPNRKLNDAETRAIVDKLDEILGFK